MADRARWVVTQAPHPPAPAALLLAMPAPAGKPGHTMALPVDHAEVVAAIAVKGILAVACALGTVARGKPITVLIQPEGWGHRSGTFPHRAAIWLESPGQAHESLPPWMCAYCDFPS
jgi:hypothetical protein